MLTQKERVYNFIKGEALNFGRHYHKETIGDYFASFFGKDKMSHSSCDRHIRTLKNSEKLIKEIRGYIYLSDEKIQENLL